MKVTSGLWSPADLDAAKQIHAATYPEYQAAADGVRYLRRWQPASQWSAPRLCIGRYLASEKGVLAYASLWESRPGKLRFDLMTHPARRRRGAGQSLLTRLLSDAAGCGAATLQARVRDDHPEAADFLARRGFAETQRMSALELLTAGFQYTPWSPLVDRLARNGIVITTLEQEQAAGEDWLSRLRELYNAALPDWPDPDSGPGSVRPVTLEDFRRRAENEFKRRETFFIATARNLYVGACCLLAFGTAVHPLYRGQGIATALKASALRLAKEQGITALTTGTASPAMRAVNGKLGYRVYGTEIRLVKRLD
ncbi:MAG TPA: GNAT family N-acetyltransferase [Bryobacteraceae bacterium]|jgi:GNAT superfamily N-acetyltransferase|nr:GNAT family N-acetyltransferase [Bryobacteraceae bacterium]